MHTWTALVNKSRNLFFAVSPHWKEVQRRRVSIFSLEVEGVPAQRHLYCIWNNDYLHLPPRPPYLPCHVIMAKASSHHYGFPIRNPAGFIPAVKQGKTLKFLLPAPQKLDFGPKTAKFGPKLAFWAKYRHFWPI